MSRDALRGRESARISGGDSGKKPCLASGDEARSRCARKFFYCQKPRLRVRANCFLPASMSRGDIDCAMDARFVN
jgi:hypothetical protein